MRNWNEPMEVEERNLVHASRLPMRNWNQHRVLHKQSFRILLPDYLWGIETYMNWLIIYQISCFQTTYEELKLVLTPIEDGSIMELPDYLWGIETWDRVAAIDLDYASRLPMRNWNQGPTVWWFVQTGLPDYLWGIETLFMRNIFQMKTLLPDYLWGIETQIPATWYIPESGFQTTYEELKPVMSYCLTGESPASRLPMRNWNL